LILKFLDLSPFKNKKTPTHIIGIVKYISGEKKFKKIDKNNKKDTP
tara:strand:+ start:334 stop:471 length:138 start_codon:yes stop_codon:yes gene_type:complete